MKKMLVLSGAGISAESGVETFRDSNGLWCNHRVEDVASPEGWVKNPELVLDFYNQRRKQLSEVKPNYAHKFFAEMEHYFDVQIITQNVDDLHERGGSSNVLHLHGELKKVRSTKNPALIYDWGFKDLNIGDCCEQGNQLRPHIVWFGEQVPELENAISLVQEADIMVVIGTSMQVYPAASLIGFAKNSAKIVVIDPKAEVPFHLYRDEIVLIKEVATTGVEKMRKMLFDSL